MFVDMLQMHLAEKLKVSDMYWNILINEKLKKKDSKQEHGMIT